MATQRPLVLISGRYSELPAGDTPIDVTVGTYVVGSGLTGGDNFSQASTLAVAIAPAASGLIFVGTGASARLADDGSAQRLADQALASGVYALDASAAASASGVTANVISAQAIASGVAVEQAVANIPRGTYQTYYAGASIVSGNFVGINPANYVEPVRTDLNILRPSGIYWGTVSSGTSSYWRSIVYAPNIDRFVVYQYETNVLAYSTVRVLESNGSSFTVGAPYTVSSYGSTYGYLSYNTVDDNFLISYYNNSAYLAARNFTVDPGTNTIVWGTNKVVNSVASNYIRSTFNPDENVHLIHAQQTTGGFAWAAVVSGTNFFPGPKTLIDSSCYGYCDIAYSTQDKKALFTYTSNTSDPYYGFQARIVVSSGVNLYPVGGRALISRNTPVYPNSYYGYDGRVAYDSDQNLFATVHTDVYDGYGLKFNAVRISGISLEVGEPKHYLTYGQYNAIAYNSTTKSFLCNSTWVYPSGSSIGLQVDQDLNVIGGEGDPWSAYIFPSGTTTLPGTLPYYNEIAADTTRGQFISTCYTNYNSYTTTSGICIIHDFTQGTFPYNQNNINNIAGIAQDNAASGTAVTVRMPGTTQTGFTGLSAGRSYYVDPTTSGLTTSSTRPPLWSGTWRSVGTALSSTTLLLESDL